MSAYTLRIHWGLRAYVAEELVAHQRLAKVLSITGDAQDAFMGSCHEYMSWRWPGSGIQTLDTVQAIVDKGDGNYSK